MMLSLQSLFSSCSSLFGFACWLSALVALIVCSPLRGWVHAAAFLCAGFYLVTIWPTAYFSLGFAVLVDTAVQFVGTQLQAAALSPSITQFAAQISDTVGKNVLGSWFVRKCAQCNLRPLAFWSRLLEDRVHVALLLFWFPKCLSWGTMIRLTSLCTLVTATHALLLSKAMQRVPQPSDPIALWAGIIDSLSDSWVTRDRTKTFAVVVGLLWMTPAWLCALAHLNAALFIAGLVFLDPGTLLVDWNPLWEQLVDLLPREVDLEITLTPLLWRWTQPFRSLRAQVEGLDSERSARHAILGFSGAHLLILTSLLSQSLALVLFATACAATCMNAREEISLRTYRLLGLLACISVEGLCTGYVLGFYLTSPLQWVRLVLFTFLFCASNWLVLSLTVCQGCFYTNSVNLSVRQFLFRLWTLKRQRVADGMDVIKLHNDQSTILRQTLEQVEADGRQIQVQFEGSQGMDVGGLRRQLATQLGRAVVNPPESELLAPLREWEVGAGVYDVNYEAIFLSTPEGVNEVMRKLGVILGKCLMEQMHLITLSRALCKYLLSDGDPHSQITFDDMTELCPAKQQMKSGQPEVRQSLAYGELQLPAVALPDMQYTVETGCRDEDFHPPAVPTEAQNNELASAFVCNNFAQDLRDHIRVGFRQVVDCDIGRLFSAAELQEMLKGSSEILLSDWEQHTAYRPGLTRRHPVVELFWTAMKGLTQEQLRNFCEFVTGQSTPPMGGFASLNPPFTVSLNQTNTTLISHSCFNAVELPCNEGMTVEAMTLQITTGQNERFNIA